MPLLPFANLDGSPNESAIFVNAVLTSALYHADRRPFDEFAAFSGGSCVAFASDKDSFQPDHGVILAGGKALIVLDGTTNTAQWVTHIGSGFFPAQDRFVVLKGFGHPFVFGTCFEGLRLIESLLDNAIAPIGTGEVQLTGHSYGAGCALIYGRHLSTSQFPPSRVEIITFGEPRTYDSREAIREPEFHARLIACNGPTAGTISFEEVDPVTCAPTGALSLFSFARSVKFLKPILGLAWSHHGRAFKVNDTDIGECIPDPFFPTAIPWNDALNLTANLLFASLHFMDQSYLPKSVNVWRKSGKNPELSFLLPYVAEYTGRPFVPAATTGPPISAALLNDAYFDPSNRPVTSNNRPEWEAVTAVSNFFPTSEGSFTMTLMRGSMLCNIIDQGFSETWHSASTGDSYASMQTKLANIKGYRVGLTNSVDDPPPHGNGNLLSVQFFRISDDLKQRDVFLNGVVTGLGWNGAAGNADGQLATKVVWRDANSQQIAVTYLHGVPLGGLVNGDTRKAVFTGTFKGAVQSYCNRIQSQNLGFNTLNLTPTNAMGSITGVAYNAVSGNYTFTMSLPVPQGNFRVRIARMKALRYLNGRWAAQSTGANTFVLFRPAALITWDNAGTALPLSGYNNGVVFSNYIVQVPATAAPTLIVARKLGRPFYLQAGRVSRRPAA